MWDADEFKKRVLGEYGVNPSTEPELSEIEKEQLAEILPLITSGEPSQLEQAVVEMEKLSTDASSALIDFILGQVTYQLDRTDEAVQWYEKAIAKFPAFLRAHKTYGIIQFQRGDAEATVDSLRRVVELGGDDATVYGLLGVSLDRLNKPVSAESAFRSAMLLEPDEVSWKAGLTSAVLKQQKFGEAVTLVGELLEDYPERTDFWIMQANAYLGLQQPLRAAENLELVRRMGGADMRTQKLLGDIYVNSELWELAADAYGHALEIDADEAKPIALRGVQLLAQRGAHDPAEELIEDVEEHAGNLLTDDERRELLKLESRIAVAEGEGGEAARVLEEIIELDPLDGEALMLLAEHYQNEGEIQRARLYYERAATIDEFEADAKLKLATLLVSESKYAEAIPLLKRSQELKPRTAVADYLEQIEKYVRAQR
jgi:Flp pilus assembly protein TadD